FTAHASCAKWKCARSRCSRAWPSDSAPATQRTGARRPARSLPRPPLIEGLAVQYAEERRTRRVLPIGHSLWPEYSADNRAMKGRRAELDALRGLLLVVMALTH